VKLWRVSDSKQIAEIKGDGRCAESWAACERELTFASLKSITSSDAKKHRDKSRRNSRAAKARIEADAANHENFIEKQMALTNAVALQHEAMHALNETGTNVSRLVEQFLERNKP